MIWLLRCDSRWECSKEAIAGSLSGVMLGVVGWGCWQLVCARRAPVRLQLLDGAVFYLAFFQVALEVVLHLVYSYYIIAYMLTLAQLFQEVLLCAILLLILGAIKKYSVFKCVVMLLVIYLLAVMGVAIYLSLLTDHHEDVLECEGPIWLVLSSNNLFVSLVVLLLALLSVRRSAKANPHLHTFGADAGALYLQSRTASRRKMRHFVQTFV